MYKALNNKIFVAFKTQENSRKLNDKIKTNKR